MGGGGGGGGFTRGVAKLFQRGGGTKWSMHSVPALSCSTASLTFVRTTE